MEDKLSMAHGLENRVPLLDNDLVDFALTLPSELKVARHTAETIDENTASSRSMRTEMRRRDGKRVLRDAMKLHCPPDVVDSEKQGFSAPDASWFRGESVRYLERTLMRDNAMLYEFLDRKAVQAAVEDHITGRQNRRLLVWSLLSLEHWARTFLSGGRDGD